MGTPPVETSKQEVKETASQKAKTRNQNFKLAKHPGTLPTPTTCPLDPSTLKTTVEAMEINQLEAENSATPDPHIDRMVAEMLGTVVEEKTKNKWIN